MKLKIDHIQDLISEVSSAFETHPIIAKSGAEYASINYHQPVAYIAKQIYDSILIGVKDQALEDLYTMRYYSEFSGCGFYLGVPYYSVRCNPDVIKLYDDLLAKEKELSSIAKCISEYQIFVTNAASYDIAERKQIIDRLQKDHYVKINNTAYYEMHLKQALVYLESKQKTIRNEHIELTNNITAKAGLPIEAVQNRILTYVYVSNVFDNKVEHLVAKATELKERYSNGEKSNIENLFLFILEQSFYWFDFNCNPSIEYNEQTKVLIVDYYLPNIAEIPNIKEIKAYKIELFSERELNNIYDDFIYAITIRSIAELFHFDTDKVVDTVMFNGRVASRNVATGQLDDNCILSVQVKRDEFDKIDLNFIEAKACFKHFKGVGAAKLSSLSAVVPIMETSRYDKRFRDSKEIAVDNSSNLAAMHWEDFEHLIRELFEKEFSVNGGEVKVTQASRDGGVDAIAFDPDPIRGGKIVIQAKRYTNTVGVSAVRDLYGTVINEGANKGILITTSDYGPDSYSFARAKPLTLLNGGHLLFLLEKHGQKARIDIDEAKRMAKLNQ